MQVIVCDTKINKWFLKSVFAISYYVLVIWLHMALHLYIAMYIYVHNTSWFPSLNKGKGKYFYIQDV